MGQPITVIRTPTRRDDVVRFELNRSLTGMGHERYRSREDADGPRPVDLLARRLFEVGGVEGVHVYSNVVTVDLVAGADGAALQESLERLFVVYEEDEAAR